MRQRYSRRVPLKAWVLFSNDDVFGQGRVLDLTAPGCQIESLQAVVAGQYLQLRILLPGQTSFVIVELAAIRWTVGNRFGAEFIKLDKADQDILDACLAERLPSGGGRTKRLRQTPASEGIGRSGGPVNSH